MVPLALLAAAHCLYGYIPVIFQPVLLPDPVTATSPCLHKENLLRGMAPRGGTSLDFGLIEKKKKPTNHTFNKGSHAQDYFRLLAVSEETSG